MDEDLWKRFRMIAILNDMEVSELVEQALREKLERMKQLEQYDSYKEVENLRVPKGTQQPQQSKKVITATGDDSSSVIIDYSKSSPTGRPLITEKIPQNILGEPIKVPLQDNEYELNLIIPELTFPTNKNKLIQAIEKSLDRIGDSS
jgi:hypothetical protein